MAMSDVTGGSAVVTDVGSEFGKWAALQLARLRPRHHATVARRSRGLGRDPVMQPLGSRDFIVMRPVQQAVDPPVTMVGIRDVLAGWRAAERELAEIPEGSPEWPRVHAEVVSLRASYHRLFDERSGGRPTS